MSYRSSCLPEIDGRGKHIRVTHSRKPDVHRQKYRKTLSTPLGRRENVRHFDLSEAGKFASLLKYISNTATTAYLCARNHFTTYLLMFKQNVCNSTK